MGGAPRMCKFKQRPRSQTLATVSGAAQAAGAKLYTLFFLRSRPCPPTTRPENSILITLITLITQITMTIAKHTRTVPEQSHPTSNLTPHFSQAEFGT